MSLKVCGALNLGNKAWAYSPQQQGKVNITDSEVPQFLNCRWVAENNYWVCARPTLCHSMLTPPFGSLASNTRVQLESSVLHFGFQVPVNDLELCLGLLPLTWEMQVESGLLASAFAKTDCCNHLGNKSTHGFFSLSLPSLCLSLCVPGQTNTLKKKKKVSASNCLEQFLMWNRHSIIVTTSTSCTLRALVRFKYQIVFGFY